MTIEAHLFNGTDRFKIDGDNADQYVARGCVSPAHLVPRALWLTKDSSETLIARNAGAVTLERLLDPMLPSKTSYSEWMEHNNDLVERLYHEQSLRMGCNGRPRPPGLKASKIPVSPERRPKRQKGPGDDGPGVALDDAEADDGRCGLRTLDMTRYRAMIQTRMDATVTVWFMEHNKDSMGCAIVRTYQDLHLQAHGRGLRTIPMEVYPRQSAEWRDQSWRLSYARGAESIDIPIEVKDPHMTILSFVIANHNCLWWLSDANGTELYSVESDQCQKETLPTDANCYPLTLKFKKKDHLVEGYEPVPEKVTWMVVERLVKMFDC